MAIRVEEFDDRPGGVDIDRDRLLVVRHQDGDDDAFVELYRRYHPRLVTYCQRRVGDRHVAEELAQEAFVRAFRAMPRFGGERRFYPWMTVIAGRLCIDHHRRTSRVEPAAEVDTGVIEADLDDLWASVDREHLATAVERLAPRHREILEFREQQGWSYQQIAEHLGVPLTTVEALLHRARKALRREYLAVAGDDAAGRLAVAGGIAAVLAKAKAWLLGLGPERVLPAVGAAAASIAAVGIVAAPLLERDDAPQQIEVQAPVAASTTSTAAPTEPATVGAPVTVAAAVPSASTTAGGPTTTVEPDAAVGPVGVYSSPEGQAYVDEQVESMPIVVDLGVLRVGLEPDNLLGSSVEPNQPGEEG